MGLWLRRQLSRLFRFEFVRYAGSGAAAFAGDLAVFFALTGLLAMHYLVANVAAYAVGMVISYLTNIKWVFEHRVYDDAGRTEFALFAVIVVVALLISEAGLYVMVDVVGASYFWSKMGAALFVFLFNYVVKKVILFNPNRKKFQEKPHGA